MKYLTFADLREKLGGRARSTIYLDVETGRLPAPFKLGGRLYWRDDEIDEWLRPIDGLAEPSRPEAYRRVLSEKGRAL